MIVRIIVGIEVIKYEVKYSVWILEYSNANGVKLSIFLSTSPGRRYLTINQAIRVGRGPGDQR